MTSWGRNALTRSSPMGRGCIKKWAFRIERVSEGWPQGVAVQVFMNTVCVYVTQLWSSKSCIRRPSSERRLWKNY